MINTINKIYHDPLVSRLFPTTVFCLQKSLRDCESVLDLGCGPSSPVRYCKNIRYSVGVEAFGPYVKVAQENNTHSEFILKKVEEVDFPEKSFDAVIMIELIEHIPKDLGLELLMKAEKWAKKKVVVSTPNGYLEQLERDNNPLQKHLSGWELQEMRKQGYKCHGLGGLRFLHQNTHNEYEEGDFTASIKWKPRWFWFVVAALSQAYTYRFPKRAFELFCTKIIK